MASDLFRTLPLLALAAVLGFGAAAVPVRAATGDVLIEYQSSLGTTPENQGWMHEGRSLAIVCPGSQVGDLTCWFQGSRDLNGDSLPDNSCLPGIGCRKLFEHYNSPEPQSPGSDSNTYTEWLAFDNGDNENPRPLIIPDSAITHSPPWGAPQFFNAPPYPTLRVSTGDGNNTPNTLPKAGTNYRNMGKAKIRRTYNPGTATAFTLVIKAAAGPREPGRHFVEIRAFGRRFGFGVDGKLGSPTYGKVTLVDPANQLDETHYTVVGTLFDQTVMVTQPGVEGPHFGEFFTLRVIVSESGMFNAYLNENEDLLAVGTMAPSGFVPTEEIQLTPGVGDDTMWIDYVRFLEGAVPVSCPSPIGDMNADGQVNLSDMMRFLDFCAQGPGIPAPNTFECRCVDADHDSDVDMVDFGAFQRCLTVGGQQAPGCKN